MRLFCLSLALVLVTTAGIAPPDMRIAPSPYRSGQSQHTFLGFDRNQYPGDGNLAVLRKTFDFAGFWLNTPPGASRNTWSGKREMLESAGFGFLVLFNGRLDAELKRVPDPARLARSDAAEAARLAAREGFAAGTVIFLDLEEGGRMLPEQKSYIYAWVDDMAKAGFRPGVYCSGIPAPEDHGVTVVTAADIREHAGGRQMVYWVANDACPPSPGCWLPHQPPAPSSSGVSFADIWQFAQSPRRRGFAGECGNYHQDGNCYPPGLESARRLFVDLDSATSADPSAGGSTSGVQ